MKEKRDLSVSGGGMAAKMRDGIECEVNQEVLMTKREKSKTLQEWFKSGKRTKRPPSLN